MSAGPPEAHELMIATGKILGVKVAGRYESEASELSQQKEELQAQAGPDKRHPSNYQASSDTPHGKRARIEFCSQEAVSANRVSYKRQAEQTQDRNSPESWGLQEAAINSKPTRFFSVLQGARASPRPHLCASSMPGPCSPPHR